MSKMDKLYNEICYSCGMKKVVALVCPGEAESEYICKECCVLCWVHDCKMEGWNECDCCYGIQLIQTAWRKYLARREFATMLAIGTILVE